MFPIFQSVLLQGSESLETSGIFKFCVFLENLSAGKLRTLPFGMKARTVPEVAAMAMNARRVFFRPSLFWNSQIRGVENASERARMVKLT